MMHFPVAVATAADIASLKGTLSASNASTIKNFVASATPAQLAVVESTVLHQGRSMAHPQALSAVGATAINWGNLLQFIETLLPIILQVVTTFSNVTQTTPAPSPSPSTPTTPTPSSS